MATIRLTGRASALSRWQMEIVRRKIETAMPGLKVELVPRTSRGDQLKDIPLHTVEGTDFFTREIIETLERGEADLAVHSLKDMSSAHFFGDHHFAVVDREDTHDIALLRSGWEEKVSRGEPITIGTCSPRREEMALDFLQKALPQQSLPVQIKSKPIRGNVETRLRKLHLGEFDGTILAAAGLNRLWPEIEEAMKQYGFIRIVLPLLDCVPAPCQGAIVVEALPNADNASGLLEAINDEQIWEDAVREKMTGLRYGQGCLQRFGVTTIYYNGEKTTYAAGRDESGMAFSHFSNLPDPDWKGKTIFSSTDHMRSFYDYSFFPAPDLIKEPVVYVANYKSLSDPRHGEDWVNLLSHKRVWAAGSKTWFELAGKGIQVEGCADALGLESLIPLWEKPVLQIKKENVLVLTHAKAAGLWKEKGWKTAITHQLIPRYVPELAQAIREADVVFWTSKGQYEIYQRELKPGVIHACPFGETAQQLKQAGLAPVVFPTIKSFIQWRRSSSPSVNAD
ncbi:MAG: hypothetical protein J0M30_06135 [Chitinophagales bacterium]|nr:hypothetical protein [Chitinophagales bacterium]